MRRLCARSSHIPKHSLRHIRLPDTMAPIIIPRASISRRIRSALSPSLSLRRRDLSRSLEDLEVEFRTDGLGHGPGECSAGLSQLTQRLRAVAVVRAVDVAHCLFPVCVYAFGTDDHVVCPAVVVVVFHRAVFAYEGPCVVGVLAGSFGPRRVVVFALACGDLVHDWVCEAVLAL